VATPFAASVAVAAAALDKGKVDVEGLAEVVGVVQRRHGVLGLLERLVLDKGVALLCGMQRVKKTGSLPFSPSSP